MRWRAVSTVAVGGVVAASVWLIGPSAHATPVPPAATSGSAYAVTLVTGDRVLIVDRADGKHEVTVQAGAGRAGMQFVRRTGRDSAGHDTVQVIPVDALPLLAAGRLDARLFDVTSLTRMGYDDKARATVPLIVSYRPGIRALAAPLAGATPRRALPSINGAALSESKDKAGAFWATVTDTGPGGRAVVAPMAPSGGVDRIWLDGRSRVLDDASNAQIGVPVAAQAGFTGKGVTVAVLDGGYDPTHPDLAGITTAKDFTDSEVGTTDDFGHGTHVASIVAGSGAASNGKYRGVAPDAKLIVGKVCDGEFCEDSAVMAGMEWAATEQHAKVINMSLGSEDPTDGLDPQALAVNNLTASAGSLFVIAAGNSGTPKSVGSPGSAEAALTVGSVGRTDALSDFSSQGPRIGDMAIKPDLTAPGENIIAAKAKGTELGTPVGDFYVTLSGTSMATPHVTGTAAILAQQHPDWTPAQLKAGLMSTAKAINATVYGQGAGRVDIGRAVTQAVHAEPGSLSLGFLRWPFATGPAVTRTVTYRNDGDAAETLNLALTATTPSGGAAAAGAFTLNATTVTVPAHGSTGVALTLHPDALGVTNIGSFSGRLVATGNHGSVVQTPFGTTTETESFDVTMKVIDRNGKPAGADSTSSLDASMVPVDLTSGARSPDPATFVGGVATFRVAKGTYGVHGGIVTQDPANPGLANASGTIFATPTLTVDHPGITLTYDARRAHEAGTLLVDAQGASRFSAAQSTQFLVNTGSEDVPISLELSGGANRMFALQVGASSPRFSYGFQNIVTATGHGPDRAYFLATPSTGSIPNNTLFRHRDRDLHQTDARYHAQGVPAAVGDRNEFIFFLPQQIIATGDILKTPMPSRRLEFFSAGPRYSGHILQQYPPDGFPLLFEGSVDVPDTVYRTTRLPVLQEWNEASFGPDLTTPGTANLFTREGNTIRANIAAFSPSDANHTGTPVNDLFMVTGRSTLSRDGKVIGTGNFPNVATFTVPADTGRYALTMQVNRSKPWTTLASSVNITWTFTSGPPAARQTIPVPSVKTGGAFDGNDSAKGGAPFTLTMQAGTAAGATPSAVTVNSVEFSDDDGATWQPATVAKDGDNNWQACLTNPTADHGTGFVSLRIKATNALGNQLEQTTIRAYGLTK